jgi:hypothetical protein
MDMYTDSDVLIKDAVPGREILFKRREGRGRPAMGKVVNQTTSGITVALSNGQIERVKPHLVHEVLVKKGKVPALDPITIARAREFERRESVAA